MKPNDAGGLASSERTPIGTEVSNAVSPAARKFAEYLARRMRPMIDHAHKERTALQHTNSTDN
jgi:DNA topoisomerase VI subunit B